MLHPRSTTSSELECLQKKHSVSLLRHGHRLHPQPKSCWHWARSQNRRRMSRLDHYHSNPSRLPPTNQRLEDEIQIGHARPYHLHETRKYTGQESQHFAGKRPEARKTHHNRRHLLGAHLRHHHRKLSRKSTSSPRLCGVFEPYHKA